MTFSSNTTSSTISSKSSGSKMSICRHAKSLKNTLFKSSSQKSSEESNASPPTTSLGLGGMALAVLMLMAVLCQASASPLPSPGSSTLMQSNRRDIASFNKLLQPYDGSQLLDTEPYRFMPVKRNAELINGLIGMDLNRLSAMGKRGNAELINGLIGMDLDRLSTMGRKRR